MEGKEWEGCVCRIRKCVSELLSMEEDLIDDDDDDDDEEESEDSWDIIGRGLRLKAAFLYCDLSRVIASARDEHKMALTDLGNKLFHFMEELDHAVRSSKRISDADLLQRHNSRPERIGVCSPIFLLAWLFEHQSHALQLDEKIKMLYDFLERKERCVDT